MPYVGGDRTSPATRLRLITPDDNTDLALGPCSGIWVGGAGNLAVIATHDSAAVTISGVTAGRELAVSAIRIMSTNTTATLIIALYN